MLRELNLNEMESVSGGSIDGQDDPWNLSVDATPTSVTGEAPAGTSITSIFFSEVDNSMTITLSQGGDGPSSATLNLGGMSSGNLNQNSTQNDYIEALAEGAVSGFVGWGVAALTGSNPAGFLAGLATAIGLQVEGPIANPSNHTPFPHGWPEN